MIVMACVSEQPSRESAEGRGHTQMAHSHSWGEKCHCCSAGFSLSLSHSPKVHVSLPISASASISVCLSSVSGLALSGNFWYFTT